MNLAFIADNSNLIISVLIGLVWLVRLEAKVLYLERDREFHWNKIDMMQLKLQEIAESLARLEGKLEGNPNDKL